MSRIGSLSTFGTDQLRALNQLQRVNKNISQNLLRLSTMKRINSAKDDPSGLVHASLLEQEIKATEEVANGVTRAKSLVSTADGAIGEIVDQLGKARTLALEAAGGGLSSSEIAANQEELDTILDSIDSLAGTEFNGRRLLDGSSSFRVSGVDNAKILDVDVLDKTTGEDVNVSIDVTTQATQATDSYTDGDLTEDVTLSVEGPDGTTTISLSSGADTQDIADAFNDVTHLTGIEATRVDASQVDFNTVDFGSAAEIKIEATEGTFNTTSGGSAQGTDAVATINGREVTGDGSTFNVNTENLSLVAEVDPNVSGEIDSFTVSGEGLEFVVGTAPGSTARLGLPNMTTASLGGITGKLHSTKSGGENTLTDGKATEALRIIDDAISDALREQARVGAFQKFTLDGAETVLNKTTENLSESLSAIQDTDEATESALLSKNRLLEESTLKALSIMDDRRQDLFDLLLNK